jgi:hypothetical protein
MFRKACGYTCLEKKLVLLKTIGPIGMEMLCLEMGVHILYSPWGENSFLVKIMAPLVWDSCVWKWGWMYPTLEEKKFVYKNLAPLILKF